MPKKKELSIDETLEKLNEINEQLSKTDISLDKSIELYNEGVKLAAACEEQLKGVEKELKILNE